MVEKEIKWIKMTFKNIYLIVKRPVKEEHKNKFFKIQKQMRNIANIMADINPTIS